VANSARAEVSPRDFEQIIPSLLTNAFLVYQRALHEGMSQKANTTGCSADSSEE
jgi:hypothetical protein